MVPSMFPSMFPSMLPSMLREGRPAPWHPTNGATSLGSSRPEAVTGPASADGARSRITPRQLACGADAVHRPYALERDRVRTTRQGGVTRRRRLPEALSLGPLGGSGGSATDQRRSTCSEISRPRYTLGDLLCCPSARGQLRGREGCVRRRSGEVASANGSLAVQFFS